MPDFLVPSGPVTGAAPAAKLFQTHSLNTKSIKLFMLANTAIGNFFRKYRAAILFNKNLIISAAAGFFVSAYVSQLYFDYDKNELANSIVTLASEYAVYLPLFTALFYIDNRQKYGDPTTGKSDRKLMLCDIKKLFASFGVSEIVYSIVRFGSQYAFLNVNLAAYEASMASSLLSWVVFFVTINAMAKITRLHEGK